LRPIKPEDEPLWHEMLADCSPESIRYRFRSMFREMTHEMATRFCFMDYDRELAIVAELADDHRRLIGVGHLVCDVDHTDAEYGVLVPDTWQRRGIGSLITETCLKIAADWFIGEVIGYTDRDNGAMIATFRRTGFELAYESHADIVVARKKLDVAKDQPAPPPTTPSPVA
jgi:acetyltransferase